MAGIDYGVLVRVNGKYKPELASGAGSEFRFSEGSFYRFSYLFKNEIDSDENLYFPTNIRYLKKIVLHWKLDEIEVKTRLVKDYEQHIYISTFMYNGDLYEVLQGSDVDSYDFWEKGAKKICKDFMCGKKLK